MPTANDAKKQSQIQKVQISDLIKELPKNMLGFFFNSIYFQKQVPKK